MISESSYGNASKKNHGSFPTAPDFNEILVDGTVFDADSNGMLFFRERKNEKVQLFKVIFSYLFVKKSKLCFLQMDLKSLLSLSEEDVLNIFQDYC